MREDSGTDEEAVPVAACRRSPLGGALSSVLLVAVLATGWHAWRSYQEVANVPVREALDQQTLLLNEIGTLRRVDGAVTKGDRTAVAAAVASARATVSHTVPESADARAALAQAAAVLGELTKADEAGEALSVRLRLAISALENATLAANDETRARLAKRDERLAELSGVLWVLVILLSCSVLGIVWTSRTRARDADRLAGALSTVREREDALESHRQELADKTRLLQTTLDNIDQGFAVWDSGFRLVAFNAKCLDFWYHPAGVHPGMGMMHLLRHLAETGAFGDSAPSEELASRNFDRVIAAGVSSEEEFFLADGRIIHVRRYPMPDGGHASVYSDVTDQRSSADVLERAKARAENANRAKSEFLSAMSHELRTPLNAVLGFGQLLRDDTTDPVSPRQAESVAHILSAGSHLLDLINEVLDLAKIESGKMTLDVVPVDIHEALAEVHPLVETLAEKRHITVEFPDGAGGGGEVAADPKRLRQILLNLLSNAVKYNRDGGAVQVSLSQAPRGYLRMSVADTGPGIPENKLDGLFQPFNRLGAEHTDVEGTGIGLTICRELVEAMRGDMGFTSRPGEGSIFWFELPLAGVAEDEDLPAGLVALDAPVPVLDGPRTVLFIEDQPDSRELMQRVIELLDGVTLLTANSGEDGLAMAASERVDLVLVDINLPGISGLDVLARLRADEASMTLPVIAVSARAMDDDIRAGLEAGFDAYLTKPLDLERARRVIGGALMR